MRRLDPLGGTVTALFVAGQIAAWTLLGITVYDGATGKSHASRAEPDTPLGQPEEPSCPDAA
ncbi:hypothetical protein ACQPXS_46560 (plasmid) [Streptomyces sp. CA-142005]|uniref:hypothetical protein n=1 Tax=Streptomyces sp. CA-142005 TaxID=3240052 RepID=UPI003D92BEA0